MILIPAIERIIPMTPTHDSTVALRVAQADESAVVRRLADLDDSPPLDGQVLLALVDGEAVAAVSLRDGRVVANPFLPTADTVRLLNLRASQLARRLRRPSRARAPRWPGGVPRLRAA
jgi:hypothetical protein